MTSPRNPRVADARKLLRRAHRRETRRFVMEGSRAIADALAHEAPVEQLFISEDQPDRAEFERLAQRTGIDVHVVGHQVLKSLSDSATPQGVVAVARIPDVAVGDVSGDLVVILDGVGDPGNGGTILRSAVAAGASGVFFVIGSVDPYGPKTVRAAAGALFSTAVLSDVSLEDSVESARDRGLTVIGTSVTGARPYYDADLTAPFALVVGNEAWGVPHEHLDLMDDTVTIPMVGNAESLNVATATSIVLFEALRQRRLSSRLKEHGG
ncbi:MAG: TrmH family RNA methyltransferase [Actinomycetota bacterium]